MDNQELGFVQMKDIDNKTKKYIVIAAHFLISKETLMHKLGIVFEQDLDDLGNYSYAILKTMNNIYFLLISRPHRKIGIDIFAANCKNIQENIMNLAKLLGVEDKDVIHAIINIDRILDDEQ